MGEKIDNMDEVLARAKDNGAKNLVVQPTHLMHGAEYDELCEVVKAREGDFESVKISEPSLGEVGEDRTVTNDDKKAVAEAITEEAVKEATLTASMRQKQPELPSSSWATGTSHAAAVTYDQTQQTFADLGYENVYVGTVEGKPEDTECQQVISKIKSAEYGGHDPYRAAPPDGGGLTDHANNDMAGDDDDSWKSQFEAAGAFGYRGLPDWGPG